MSDMNVSTWEGFNIGEFLEPPLANAGLFNPAVGADFCASVLFKLGGAADVIGLAPFHLFGNSDLGDATGWSLSVGPTGGPDNEYGVIAESGADAGTTALFPIGNGTLNIPKGLKERLILATMYYRGAIGSESMLLFINGDLVQTTALGAAYLDAAVSPRIGVKPVVAAAGTGLQIVGAAFSRFAVGADFFAALPYFMGEHYRSCRAASDMSLLENGRAANLRDFAHRWSARTTPILKSGPTAKAPNTVRDVFVYTQPLSEVLNGQATPDIGNQGWASTTADGSVPLVATSAGTLSVRTTENPNWHVGGAFGIAPA